MKRIHLNPVYASNKTFKRVAYHELKPVDDASAYWNGKLYGTKEDLKYFPSKVRLVNFGDFKRRLF